MKYYSFISIIILIFIIFISCGISSEKRYEGTHSLTEVYNGNTAKKQRDINLIVNQEVNEGAVIGTIYSLNAGKNEIIVSQKKVIEMGSVVYVIIDNKKILMTVVFPMLSSFKCRIVPNQMKYLKNMKKGMSVYMK